jgi:hypothetical protein
MKSLHPEVVSNFQFEGSYVGAEPIVAGHINDTYRVDYDSNGLVKHYILQRINRYVFANPEGMMRNIQLVTNHISAKILAAGGDAQRETLSLIPTVAENSYLETNEGECWRGYRFIDNARTYDRVEDILQAYHAGAAFGKFLSWLSDFPLHRLIETIPDFHHTRKRFETFVNTVEKDELNLAHTVAAEIAFILQREREASLLVDAYQAGDLLLRITHNDTKLNNVMIDNLTGKDVCVIDLDTVMPGLALYDYGDAIRSITNTAAEDEQELSKIKFDLQVFEAYTRGYLEAVGEVLSAREKELLAISAILMTLECGMRFLTDHLQGDRYFKVMRPGHNLDRCRTQMRMVVEMEEQQEMMQRTIEKYC